MSTISSTPSLGRTVGVTYTGAPGATGGNTNIIIAIVLLFICCCISLCSSVSLGGGAYAYTQQEEAFGNQQRYRGSLGI